MRDHAQVEHRQALVVGHPQVARMRVGMDLAMHEDLVQVAAHQRRGQRLHRLLGAAYRRDRVHAHAVHQFHGQHPSPAQVPQRLRHPQLRIRRQVLAEARQVGRFGLVVQLHAQGGGELVQPVGEAHPAADPGQVVGGAGEAAQHGDIRAQLRGDVRLLHLDRHLAAVMEHGAMDLGDGGAAQRFRIEHGKQFSDRRLKLFLDHRADLFHRDGRHLLLHPLQRGHVLQRDHVRARGQHLAEFDEGRPQRLQVGDELRRVGVLGQRDATRRLAVQLQPGEHSGIAIAQQQPQDLLAPAHAADRGGRGRIVSRCSQGVLPCGMVGQCCWPQVVGG